MNPPAKSRASLHIILPLPQIFGPRKRRTNPRVQNPADCFFPIPVPTQGSSKVAASTARNEAQMGVCMRAPRSAPANHWHVSTEVGAVTWEVIDPTPKEGLNDFIECSVPTHSNDPTCAPLRIKNGSEEAHTSRHLRGRGQG